MLSCKRNLLRYNHHEIMTSDIYTIFKDSLNDTERKYAPDQLFMEGDESLLIEGMKVSVVGSRKASDKGLKRAELFAQALVDRGITVVSGLAEGIDTAAHTAAINAGGRTIAVLGTPLSKAYPAKNRSLLDEIKTNHLAISQYPEGHGYHKSNFPNRNRTMALISDATVIVEASEKSGTRHQGWEALRLGRLVFIMQNVAEDKSLSWPTQMIEYGAQVLERKTLDESIDLIPELTSAVDFAF